MREMRFPIKLRLSASGHLYSAIAVPSFALAVTQAASWRGVAGTQAGSLRYLHYCGPHTHIGAAAAKVPAQTRFQVLSFGMWILVQEGLPRYHETGCAKAALLAVVINECQQCGFCTPGFVVACKAFLDKNPHPKAEDLKTGVQKPHCWPSLSMNANSA